jgi:cold shock CspA family protein
MYLVWLQFGFLNYEKEEGKKLFFHMTEVHDSAQISPGDEVEFVVVQNQRNGKYSACSLRKIT